jgi:hypothetical protein
MSANKRKSSSQPKSSDKKSKSTAAPITESEFLSSAEPITLKYNSEGNGKESQTLQLKPKKFKTGSFGWNATGKQQIEVDGKKLRCTISINFTVEKSKASNNSKEGKDEESEQGEDSS